MLAKISLFSVIAFAVVACSSSPKDTSKTSNSAASSSNSKQLKRYAQKAYRSGNYQKSINHLQQQLNVLQKKHKSIIPEFGSIYFNLGLSSLKLNRNQAASTYFEIGLPLAKHSLGTNHLLVARYNSNLGIAYLRQRLYRKAIKPIKLSVNIKKNLFGESNHHLLYDYVRLKKIYNRLNSEKLTNYYKNKVDQLKSKYSSRYKNIRISNSK